MVSVAFECARRHAFVVARQGIDTAKNAADHLDIHLLDALNHMLAQHEDESVKNGEPVRSSQLDLLLLRAAIKQTYFELDKDLQAMVKDESGCVCVWQRVSMRTHVLSLLC